MQSVRKCIGCGGLKPQKQLIKITRDFKTGNAVINPDSLTFGRSVYLCYNQSCIEKALKKSKINKALKTNVSLDKSAFCTLLQKPESEDTAVGFQNVE